MDQVQAEVFIKRVIPGVCSERLEPLQVGSFHLLWLEQGPGSEVGKQSEGLQSRPGGVLMASWILASCHFLRPQSGVAPQPPCPVAGLRPNQGAAQDQQDTRCKGGTPTFQRPPPSGPQALLLGERSPVPSSHAAGRGPVDVSAPGGGVWLGQEDSLKGGGRQTGQRGIWVKETRHMGWGGAEQIQMNGGCGAKPEGLQAGKEVP